MRKKNLVRLATNLATQSCDPDCIVRTLLDRRVIVNTPYIVEQVAIQAAQQVTNPPLDPLPRVSEEEASMAAREALLLLSSHKTI
eukprot:5955460-Pleurochrysis_carterae.AAC.1